MAYQVKVADRVRRWQISVPQPLTLISLHADREVNIISQLIS